MADQERESGAPQPLSGDQVRSLHQELRNLASDRNSNYAHRREMYTGDHWGQPGLEKPPPTQKRYTLTANYIRPTIDKSIQLLLGQLPAIQVMPPGTDAESRQRAEKMEALIYYTWDCNKAELVFRRVAWNQHLLSLGVAYYWWDAKAKEVKFRSVAPDNFYPVYDGEDLIEAIVVERRNTRALQRMYPDLADQITSDNEGDDVFDETRWAERYGELSNPLSESGYYGTDRGEPRTSVGGQTTVINWFDTFGNHVRVMGQAVKAMRLGYNLDEVPIILFPHSLNGDEREARSEVDEIIDLNLYLDDMISDQANIIRKYARPTVIDKGSGVSPQTVMRMIQQDGGVLPVRRDAEVTFLNWEGTPPDFMNQYNRILGLIYDLSGKPPSSYGQLMSNQSGVATNMAMSPTTASTEERSSVFGWGLQELNRVILHLNERFMKGTARQVQGIKPRRAGTKAMVPYQYDLNGEEIDGWRKTRIKWPSALRTDDPVYVQNEISKSKADGENPPMQSLYTTLENLGIEDVEQEIDRIAEQMEDARLHPGRMTAAVNAASTLGESMVPDDLGGLDPALQPPPVDDAEMMNRNAGASGSPHKDDLVGGY